MREAEARKKSADLIARALIAVHRPLTDDVKRELRNVIREAVPVAEALGADRGDIAIALGVSVDELDETLELLAAADR